MLALAAAVSFGIALLFNLFDASLGEITESTLVVLGLLLVALHLGGVGAGRSFSTRSWGRRARR
ncbi:hypothetical protein JK358_22335 [Nocardia sp. 2]|uniref:Uncharacterized protein n=1 Tax=Nocardia acididurans TaxID=2802282 RepID=A0ABS1M9A5_9NOCA|nr:hypothetical protein [Nocardia acididurans]MBL1077141.1 hypothetical protein [Nocardia acididurans]